MGVAASGLQVVNPESAGLSGGEFSVRDGGARLRQSSNRPRGWRMRLRIAPAPV